MIDLMSTKKMLQEQLKEALKELAQLDERLQQKAEYGHGKGDPAIYEWELTLALRQQAQARVETIRQALQKCEEGRYGICERCGAPIDPERLEILPLTTLCINCARTVRA
ncbi:MAG: TraR/DksA C4-type zinc finger protein [Candidatus Hadarchaeum sp.]